MPENKQEEWNKSYQKNFYAKSILHKEEWEKQLQKDFGLLRIHNEFKDGTCFHDAIVFFHLTEFIRSQKELSYREGYRIAVKQFNQVLEDLISKK